MTAQYGAPIRLAIIDDNAAHREIYRYYLCDASDIKIVSEDSNGEAGVLSVREKDPDIVLLDFQLTGMTGVEAARKIKVRNETCKVFSLTSHTDPCIIKRMIEERNIDAVGIKGSGYLSDNFEYVIRYVLNNNPFLDPHALAVLRVPDKQGGVSEMTRREFEVFIQSQIGRSNEEISLSLNVDISHIRNIRSKIKRKLGGSNHTDLLAELEKNK